ncbi:MULTISPECIES: TonB-dependent siderophore receptor [Acinetobacter]|uniref:TonB-dependent receptor plug domain-containing protein n=1 Tax=Acinetobacter TaxID=469 RepID=UPI001436CC00|nr:MULTISPECIES: TonB-dependent receptor [Acinetobacter]MCA4814497.1 TonB-dependent receptor [Acinetobacter towneri]QIV93102.1 TonB-dependent receptor [Acinetobacter towneri]
MSTLFQPTALVGAIALAMGFSASVSAQDSSNVVNASLDTLVVTATRSEEKIKDVPARINVIGTDQIEQSPIASFPQLMMTDASINMVQSGGYGQIASLFMRGTESDHTLVLRDGVRLNNDASGLASNSFIDTTEIKQIEILKGPASVLYGTNAIGGVVQMITKTPSKNSAFISAEVGENSTYKTILGLDAVENGFYAQLRGQRLETDGTNIFDYEGAEPSSYDQKGFSGKFGYASDALDISLEHSENEGRSQYENYSWTTYAYSPRAHDFLNQVTTLSTRYQASQNTELKARVSHFKDVLTQLNVAEETTFVSDEYDLSVRQNLTAHQNLTFGVNYKALDTETHKPSDSFQEQLDSTGYYAQHQLQTDKLKTQIGVRIEDHEKYGSHTVGQAAARYFFKPHISIYSNIGSAFKAPTMNDLYYGNYANPELKPEESVSYEVGADWQMSSAWRSGLSVYRTEIDNLIDSDPANGWKFANIDETTIDGTEVYLHFNRDQWFAKTSYSYSKATNDASGEDLSRRPRQKIALSLGLAEEVYGLSATLTANSRSDSSAYDEDSIPGHMQIDLHGYYNANPYTKLFFNIQNAGDVNYKMASAGNSDGQYYLSGGRVASAGVTFRY